MFKITSQKSLHPKQSNYVFYKGSNTPLSAKSHDSINPHSATNLDNHHSQSTLESKLAHFKSMLDFTSSKNKNNTQARKSSLKDLSSNHQSSNYKLGLNQIQLDENQPNSSPSSKQQYSIPVYFQIEGESEKEKFQYEYNQKTKCSQFYKFLLGKIIEKHNKGNNRSDLTEDKAKLLFYFKSGNMHIDYFITLLDQDFILINSITDKVHIKACKLNRLSIGFNLKIFEIIKCIGSGGFSKVFLARAYGIMMAIKVIQKELISQNSKKTIIENQNQILQACSNHPFVTKLYLSFQTNKYIVFGLQYCNGGELFNLLRKVKRMKEHQAKFYFLETLSVIAYLHSKNILYRDLKPENIILDYQGHIRLADYGLSKMLRQGKTYSFCGSAQYMAPQMLLKTGHSFEVDYYCLGALLYQLVTGLPPYYSRNQNQLFSNILHNQLTFPENPKWPLSKPLREFLTKLLDKNIADRFHSVQEMFEYQWLKGTTLDEVVRKQLKPPFKLDVLDYNFDDSQFAQDQQREMRRLQLQRQYGQVKQTDQMMQNFLFESTQLKIIRQQIEQVQSLGLKKQKLQRHSKKLTENIESGRKFSTEQSNKFLNKYLSKFVQGQSKKQSQISNEENSTRQMTAVSQVEEKKTEGKKSDIIKNNNINNNSSIPQRISYVKGVLSGINQARSLEMLKNYSPTMQNFKNTQNAFGTQSKPQNDIDKVSKKQPIIQTAGTLKNNQLNSNYNKSALSYTQIRNQFPQSPTNQYTVNNQPYQQINFQKKPYMHATQNFSMTDAKYSQANNLQNSNYIQKTIMFNKSKQKVMGQGIKANNAYKAQRKSTGLTGFQYTHNQYSSKMSGDIREKTAFNYYGSPSAKNQQ